MRTNRPSYFIAFCIGLLMQLAAVLYSITIHYTVIMPKHIEYSEEQCFWYHLPSLVLIIWSTCIQLFYNHHHTQTEG